MSGHTPGPWYYDAQSERILGASPEVVVYEMNTNEADALLIAAAPDLLNACNALLGLMHLIEPRCDDTLLEIVRRNHRVEEAKAAIAKAGQDVAGCHPHQGQRVEIEA